MPFTVPTPPPCQIVNPPNAATVYQLVLLPHSSASPCSSRRLGLAHILPPRRLRDSSSTLLTSPQCISSSAFPTTLCITRSPRRRALAHPLSPRHLRTSSSTLLTLRQCISSSTFPTTLCINSFFTPPCISSSTLPWPPPCQLVNPPHAAAVYQLVRLHHNSVHQLELKVHLCHIVLIPEVPQPPDHLTQYNCPHWSNPLTDSKYCGECSKMVNYANNNVISQFFLTFQIWNVTFKGARSRSFTFQIWNVAFK